MGRRWVTRVVAAGLLTSAASVTVAASPPTTTEPTEPVDVAAACETFRSGGFGDRRTLLADLVDGDPAVLADIGSACPAELEHTQSAAATLESYREPGFAEGLDLSLDCEVDRGYGASGTALTATNNSSTPVGLFGMGRIIDSEDRLLGEFGPMMIPTLDVGATTSVSNDRPAGVSLDIAQNCRVSPRLFRVAPAGRDSGGFQPMSGPRTDADPAVWVPALVNDASYASRARDENLIAEAFDIGNSAFVYLIDDAAWFAANRFAPGEITPSSDAVLVCSASTFSGVAIVRYQRATTGFTDVVGRRIVQRYDAATNEFSGSFRRGQDGGWRVLTAPVDVALTDCGARP